MNHESQEGHVAFLHEREAPGLVLCHPWWGLTSFFREVCVRFFDEGFSVIAPDLFEGERARTIEEAERLRARVDFDGARARVKEASERLHEYCRGPLHAIGWSLGGRFALSLVEEPQSLTGAVIFYASPADQTVRTHARVQAHFASEDEWGADPAAADALTRRLREAGALVETHTYEGTQHWFFERDRPEYNDEAAALAWERTLHFLQQAKAD